MRLGFWDIKWKPTNSYLSGRAHHLRAQKVKISLLKYEKHAYCFFQHYQSCAYIFVPQEQATNITALTPVCGKMCSKNNLRSGIPLCLWMNFGLQTKWLLFHTFCSPDLALLVFSLFKKLQMAFEIIRYS